MPSINLGNNIHLPNQRNHDMLNGREEPQPMPVINPLSGQVQMKHPMKVGQVNGNMNDMVASTIGMPKPLPVQITRPAPSASNQIPTPNINIDDLPTYDEAIEEANSKHMHPGEFCITYYKDANGDPQCIIIVSNVNCELQHFEFQSQSDIYVILEELQAQVSSIDSSMAQIVTSWDELYRNYDAMIAKKMGEYISANSSLYNLIYNTQDTINANIDSYIDNSSLHEFIYNTDNYISGILSDVIEQSPMNSLVNDTSAYIQSVMDGIIRSSSLNDFIYDTSSVISREMDRVIADSSLYQLLYDTNAVINGEMEKIIANSSLYDFLYNTHDVVEQQVMSVIEDTSLKYLLFDTQNTINNTLFDIINANSSLYALYYNTTGVIQAALDDVIQSNDSLNQLINNTTEYITGIIDTILQQDKYDNNIYWKEFDEIEYVKLTN